MTKGKHENETLLSPTERALQNNSAVENFLCTRQGKCNCFKRPEVIKYSEARTDINNTAQKHATCRDRDLHLDLFLNNQKLENSL